MIPEIDPSARMQVRSRGDLVAPASCCICGSGTHDDGYLDVGIFVDFFGSVYFCMTCATQAGETIGLFTPEEVKHLNDQNSILLEQVEALTTELNNANERANAAESHLRHLYSSSGGSAADSLVEVTAAGTKPVTEPAGGADGGEPEPAKSVKGSKPRASGAPKLRNTTFE